VLECEKGPLISQFGFKMSEDSIVTDRGDVVFAGIGVILAH
jgi:hypothetical protein